MTAENLTVMLFCLVVDAAAGQLYYCLSFKLYRLLFSNPWK
jgi:hypothetical protein